MKNTKPKPATSKLALREPAKPLEVPESRPLPADHPIRLLMEGATPKVEPLPESEPVIISEPVAESEPVSLNRTDSTIPPPLVQTEPVTVSEPVSKTEPVRLLPDDTAHLRFPYEVLDGVLSRLKPASRAVLIRLYRLSAGWYSETCNVSIPKLAAHCKMGETQVRRYLKELEDEGYIKRLGDDTGNADFDARGTRIKVMLPQMTPPKKRTGSENRTGFKTEPNKDQIKETNKRGAASPNFQNCPDCSGTGFWYPRGEGNGVAKCSHPKLKGN
jgi:DNA-binding Lrp family transcriptional regulator